MPADRHQPRVFAANIAARQLQVDDRPHIVAAVAVVGDAHAPYHHRGASLSKGLGEPKHLRTCESRAPLKRPPAETARPGLDRFPARRALRDELAVYPVIFYQVLQDAVEERDIPAGEDLKKIIGDFGAEERTLGDGGHPIALHAWLAIRIHNEHSGAGVFSVIKILGGHGLVIGHVAADKHQQLCADPVRIGAGGGGAAHGRVQGCGAGGVTDPRAGIHMIRADEARHLLVCVVVLIGEPTRSQVPGHSTRVGCAQAVGNESNSFVPSDPSEAFLAPASHHRHRHAPELAKLPFPKSGETSRVLKHPPVHGRHGIESHQLQAYGAQVNALHRPIAHAGGAQRTAVTAAITQDSPGVPEVVSVLPDKVQDRLVVVGMLLVQSVGDEAHPIAAEPASSLILNVSCHFKTSFGRALRCGTATNTGYIVQECSGFGQISGKVDLPLLHLPLRLGGITCARVEQLFRADPLPVVSPHKFA